MKNSISKNKGWSIRRLSLFSLSIIVIPLFLTVLLFDWYAVGQQLKVMETAHKNTLSIYQNKFDEVIGQAEYFTATITAYQTNFEAVVFAKNKIDVYTTSNTISGQCTAFLQTHETLSAFFIYSQKFDYNRLVYNSHYPQFELTIIRNAVKEASMNGDDPGSWHEVNLPDRTVLLFIHVRWGTVFATLVDPARQSFSGIDSDENIFYTSPGNVPYLPQPFSPEDIAKENGVAVSNADNKNYQMVSLPLNSIGGRVYFVGQVQPFFEILTPMQIALLILTACLLSAIPIYWLTLRRQLLDPLSSMTGILQLIQEGKTDVRMPEDSNIHEVRRIFQTVNAMMNTISQQKINSYEQELEIQRTEMQCMQLQIRPHFFLNCLSKIYSLAGEQNYPPIQELSIDLSAYFRNIFNDGSQFIPLESELDSVGRYVRLQQIGTNLPPRLWLNVDPASSKILIPPLSILTFVENSIKHSKRIDSPLEIIIQCSIIQDEDKNYLNITITDNGGGFSEKMLEQLNSPSVKKSDGQHIGIANVRQRLRLLYNDEAALCFMNLSDRASVELFLPIENEKMGGEHQ